MAEPDTFAKRLLSGADREESRNATTRERQPTAQPPSLEAVFKDGRKRRGFAWGHYSDFEWTDEGEVEKVTVFFGNRILTIEGELLDSTAADVAANRLIEVRELTRREVEALRHDNPDRKPIVTRLIVEPEASQMAAAIREQWREESSRE